MDEDLQWLFANSLTFHKQLEIPPDAIYNGSGYINAIVYQECSERMKKNNPMHNPETVEKMRKTKIAKFASGELKPCVWDENQRQEISKRMRGDNNPLRKRPELTGSAKPIRVFYDDGRIEIYPYGKYLCKIIGCSYASVKLWIKTGKGSKQHNIIRVEII
jgi:hypothetical protein